MKVRTFSGWSFVVRWRVAAFVLVAAMCLFWSSPAVADDDDDDGDAVSGEIVIKLNPDVPGTSEEKIQAVYRDYPEVDAARTDNLLKSSGIYLLRLSNPSATENVIERMESDQATAQNRQQAPRFRYAEPNFTTDTPEGDPRWKARGGDGPNPSSDPTPYSSQYAVNMLGLSCAQGINKGAGTTVAVLDTGVQSDHPELSGSLAPGYNFIEDNADSGDVGNGVDDDGDGEVDEMVGHGTHVAGIVHLVAPEAEIMPMKVLDSDGTGNVFVIAEAVQRAVDNGADVINMSLGSSGESDLLEDIVEDLAREAEYDDGVIEDDDDDDAPAITGVPAHGVAVVASAGNENSRIEHYPAAHEEALAVASTNEGKTKSEFSSFGPWVDITAPGEDVYSLFPESRYASWDGTSMAAPFVAGQAALIRSMRPNMPTLIDADDDAGNPPPSVFGLIEDTAGPLSLSGAHAGMMGAGLADVCASVRGANPAPTVSATTPRAGARIASRRPTIAATVRDPGARLQKGDIRISLNGINRNFRYNAINGRLTYNPPRLAYKHHIVRVVATDDHGKRTIRSWRFIVAR